MSSNFEKCPSSGGNPCNKAASAGITYAAVRDGETSPGKVQETSSVIRVCSGKVEGFGFWLVVPGIKDFNIL